MARQSGAKDYIVARKGPKLYMENVITTETNSNIDTDKLFEDLVHHKIGGEKK